MAMQSLLQITIFILAIRRPTIPWTGTATALSIDIHIDTINTRISQNSLSSLSILLIGTGSVRWLS
jgi:hypothetical protein